MQHNPRRSCSSEEIHSVVEVRLRLSSQKMYQIVTSRKGNWILHQTTGDVLVRDKEKAANLWVPNSMITFDQYSNPVFKTAFGGTTEAGVVSVDRSDDLESNVSENDVFENGVAATQEQEIQIPHKEVSKELHTQKSVWSHDATLALISAVESRYDDLFHISKKKTFWSVVSEELSGFSFDYPAKACTKKWENLIRTYKSTKDNKTKTGRGPTRFPYFERLDDLLGDSPTNSSPHSIDVNKEAQNMDNETGTMAGNSAAAATPESISPTTPDEPPTSKKIKRKNPTMEYVKVKKAYYFGKETERQKREERLDNYLTESLRLKNERLKCLTSKMKLEERKVAALEAIARESTKISESEIENLDFNQTFD